MNGIPFIFHKLSEIYPGTLTNETLNLSYWINGILFPKLFWPTVRKNCSSDREKLLKEGRKFAKFVRSLVQFIGIGKGQIKFETDFFF